MEPEPGSLGEHAVVRRLADRWPTVGDDAAVLRWPPVPGRPAPLLLFATDTVVAGVHADLDLVGADDFGWKALVVAVSDLAAMGGEPGYAVAAVSGPLGVLDRAGDLDRLFDGLDDAGRAYCCPVVGGDLTDGPVLTVSVAVTGWLDGAAPAVARSGASPGDVVFVTGELGRSAGGLVALRAGSLGWHGASELIDAYRRPRARLAEGRAARAAGATAMIDISDGLASEVRHLAAASRVGIHLDADSVPVPVDAGITLEQALGGGEDYELLFTLPPGLVASATAQFAAAGLRPPVLVGRCTDASAGCRLDGEELPALGWEHRW